MLPPNKTRRLLIWLGWTHWLLLGQPAGVRGGMIRFTNVECRSFNESLVVFKECELRLIKRDVVGLNIYAEVYQLPITSWKINLAVLKKSNGYNPFMLNQTLDFCQYMRNPNAYGLFKLFHKAFAAYSNVNHTCPYEHDLIVKDLIYHESMMSELTFPNGNYMIQIKMARSRVWCAELNIFIARLP